MSTGYFEFWARTRVHCAVGATVRLPALLASLGAKRVLLLSDKGLEKIGLVERQQDPRDARVAYAAITDTGRELLNNAVVVAEQISKDLLRNCPTAHFDELSTALGLIAGMNATNS